MHIKYELLTIKQSPIVVLSKVGDCKKIKRNEIIYKLKRVWGSSSHDTHLLKEKNIKVQNQYRKRWSKV